MSTNGIPTSFTASVDRPFDPIGVRDLTAQLYDRNNQHLTDEQVQAIVQNPQPSVNPRARLEQLNANANADAQINYENQKIYNLSFRDLAVRLTNTIHDILDDLVNFNTADGLRGFIQIFTQSDRLMYAGIIIIIVTVAIMFFRTGDTIGETVPKRGGGAGNSPGGYYCGCHRYVPE